MDILPEYDTLELLVRRVFYINDITTGSEQQGYRLRYRGHFITEDTGSAYDQLAEFLKPYQLVPLFREEENDQIILIVPALPAAKPGKPALNLVMFVLTLISVLVSGGLYNQTETLPTDPLQWILTLCKNGWPFAVSLLTILGAHEFGHYFAGKKHGQKVSLPFFIPLPLSSLGTMGAFINMKEPPKNKRVLMDIAVAGPLAGYLVSIIVLLIGLSLSSIDQIPLVFPEGQGMQIEGNSITYLLLKWITFGQLYPQPVSFGESGALLYWLRYFFTASPFPLGGMDVMIHPVAWAGWAGLLVTSLNLIPAGQLDGGHIFYLLFGKKGSKKILPFILAALVGLGFLWNGWWLWAALVFLFGRVYAEPLDQITELDQKHKILGYVALAIFLLTFTPVPLSVLY